MGKEKKGNLNGQMWYWLTVIKVFPHLYVNYVVDKKEKL